VSPLRGLWPVIAGCISIAACAAQSTAPSVSFDGPLYAAGEWVARPEAVHATSPTLRRAPTGAAADTIDVQNAPTRFSSREMQRIADVQEIVRAAAVAEDLPPELVNGIIWVESRFQPQAQSSVGCLGLMQLMPSTGREIAQRLGLRYAPSDPAFNIQAGTYYFARLIDRYSSLRLALAAYNIGPAVVDGWQRDHAPLPERSQAYVDNVFSAARAFRGLPR
jgi:soluble lytic murein transglycosylase-like protein